jgi:triacylglycerol lipase
MHFKMKPTLPLFLTLIVLLSCNGESNKKPSELDSQPPYTEKTACLLSQISYCPAPQISLDKYMPGWKLAWDATELDGNHAFVASDGTSYAIAIRGSLIEFSWSAFQNWIYQDLNIVSLEKWPYTNDSSRAKIAEGTYEGFQNMNKMVDKTTGKTLLAFLENETKENTPILITGHSLGGNLATVYASWLWQQFKNAGHPRENINVITFAAPAAGNESFADDFDKKFPNALRFENKNDIVPKFPASSAVSGLGDLFDTTLAASKISVGYKNVTMPLDKVFGLLSTALKILEFTNGNAVYKQPCGKGKELSINLSGKNTGKDITNWLSEAGYQHGIARYAAQLDVVVVDCGQ